LAVNIRRSANIHGYTFEAINKGQYARKVIENFDHLVKVPNNTFSPIVHIGAYDYSVQLHQWKITDLPGTLRSYVKMTMQSLTLHPVLRTALIVAYLLF
jgi:hypothetical protein